MELVSVYCASRGEVCALPFDRFLATVPADEITLLAAPGRMPLALSRHLPLGFGFKTYLFNGDTVCTVGYRREGIRYHEPFRGSNGSQATYWLVDAPEDGMLVLGQHLPAGASTSTHWHPEGESEHFYPLCGGGTVMLAGTPLANDDQRAVVESRKGLALDGDGRSAGLRIEPPVVHQLVNESDAPALNVIVIRPTRARALHELKHHHVSWV